MAKKSTPVPQRAGTPKAISKAQLKRKLVEIRSRDPQAYEALLVLISRMVDESSTKT